MKGNSMKLIKRLKDLFGGKAKEPVRFLERIEPNVDDHNIIVDEEPRPMILDEKTGIMVETDDPFIAQIVAQTFKTGKPHIGRRDDKGNAKIDKLEP